MNKQGSTDSSSNSNSTPTSNPPPLSNQKRSTTETSTSSPSIVPTPPSVTSLDNEPDDSVLATMDAGEGSKEATSSTTANNLQIQQDNPAPALEGGADNAAVDPSHTKKPSAKKGKSKGRKKKKSSKEKVSADSDADRESEDDSDDESSDSEDEKEKKRRKKKSSGKKAAEKRKPKAKTKSKGKKKSKKHESSSDESSSDTSASSSDSDSESEDEKKKRKAKAKAKAKAKKRNKKYDLSSDESSSDSSSDFSSSDSSSESEGGKKKRKKKAKAKKKAAKSKKAKKAAVKSDSSSSNSDSEESDSPATTPESSSTETAADDGDDLNAKVVRLKEQLAAAQLLRFQQEQGLISATSKETTDASKKDDKKKAKKNGLEYKRVDQVWDVKIRDYRYSESAEEQKDEFDCVFTVRRKFGWDNKYEYTMVDIKSKLLQSALQVVFQECKSISLVEDTPSIHPNTLFLYYGELKHHYRKTLKSKLKKAKKRKDKKRIAQQIAQCKLLASYIDEDYDSVRKTLKPMMKSGTITWDLSWALFKPNTIVFTPTYGNKDDPRCFKVDWAYDDEDFMGNQKWLIDGRYLEYDGKIFGMGAIRVEIPQFKGPKKIANLPVYPLEYHKDPEGVKKQLIERGKKFVTLQGMNYRVLRGLAYMKVKRSVVKVNVNGRVMVDPAIFRRINPNYPLSYIKQDELGQDDSDSDSDNECCDGSDDENESEKDDKPRMKTVLWKDKKGRRHLLRISADDVQDILGEKLESVEEEDGSKHIFTEEELLISSPVVLGFAFSEKLWMEFSLSGIEEIKWNNEAFDQLVLPKNIKQNLKGLVSSHRFNAAKTIDDVIQGKGKGLNVVLHGPPGVGKTLTGESIAEYLRCPLYAVSAGELGTNSRSLEFDLNRIMDITHSWGAILLLDEADVFLEARQAHDIHRNSLVSVFLRLLEYYQGILFLTTNRVETFDEAFQSRIHMGIRYENLTSKARKEIWQHHVGKVEKMEGQKMKPFHERDFEELSKKDMNGRQIKNTVKTSQAIAIAEKQVFGMEHIKRVLEVAEDFENDMRGGLGYRDAMKQYV